MKQRPWNDADRQAFRDGERLRASSINGKRFDGPTTEEWDEDDDPKGSLT
jgi:hypothetical protein